MKRLRPLALSTIWFLLPACELTKISKSVSPETGKTPVTVSTAQSTPSITANSQSISTPLVTQASGELHATTNQTGTIQYELVTPAGQGTVLLSTSDSRYFSYIPNIGASGSDHFSFRARIGALASQPADVQISITVPGTGTCRGCVDDSYGDGGVISLALPASSQSFYSQVSTWANWGETAYVALEGLIANSPQIEVRKYGANGMLDVSYGATGVARPVVTGSQMVSAIAIDGSGRLLLGGMTNVFGFITALAPTGQVDPAFNSGAPIGLQNETRPLALFARSDNSSWLGGQAKIFRFSSDGTNLDGPSGFASIFSSNGDSLYAPAPGDKLLAVKTSNIPDPGGSAQQVVSTRLLRYQDSGADTSFNGIGYVDFSQAFPITTTARGIAAQPDGKVLVALDYADWTALEFTHTAFLRRLNENGSADIAFGTQGSVTLADAGAIAIAGNHIYVLSTTAINAFNSDGSVDTAFGTNGRVTLPIDTSWQSLSYTGTKLLLQGLVHDYQTNQYTFRLLRMNP